MDSGKAITYYQFTVDTVHNPVYCVYLGIVSMLRNKINNFVLKLYTHWPSAIQANLEPSSAMAKPFTLPSKPSKLDVLLPKLGAPSAK